MNGLRRSQDYLRNIQWWSTRGIINMSQAEAGNSFWFWLGMKWYRTNEFGSFQIKFDVFRSVSISLSSDSFGFVQVESVRFVSIRFCKIAVIFWSLLATSFLMNSIRFVSKNILYVPFPWNILWICSVQFLIKLVMFRLYVSFCLWKYFGSFLLNIRNVPYSFAMMIILCWCMM